MRPIVKVEFLRFIFISFFLCVVFFFYIPPGQKARPLPGFSHLIFIPFDCGLEWRRRQGCGQERTGRSGRKREINRNE